MFEVDYQLEGGLENLLKRLKIGQRLKGRIVDTIEPNGYLLRIQGYNILTQSKGSFKRFDEIEVFVQQIEPDLRLNLVQNTVKVKRETTGMDITV